MTGFFHTPPRNSPTGIGLPCLLFKNISEARLSLTDAWRYFAVMSVASLAVALLGAGAARCLRLPLPRRKTFIHTSFHCNTAFVGLPLILYALRVASAGTETRREWPACRRAHDPVFNIMSVIVSCATPAAQAAQAGET
jgi:hypothetical protein